MADATSGLVPRLLQLLAICCIVTVSAASLSEVFTDGGHMVRRARDFIERFAVEPREFRHRLYQYSQPVNYNSMYTNPSAYLSHVDESNQETYTEHNHRKSKRKRNEKKCRSKMAADDHWDEEQHYRGESYREKIIRFFNEKLNVNGYYTKWRRPPILQSEGNPEKGKRKKRRKKNKKCKGDVDEDPQSIQLSLANPSYGSSLNKPPIHYILPIEEIRGGRKGKKLYKKNRQPFSRFPGSYRPIPLQPHYHLISDHGESHHSSGSNGVSLHISTEDGRGTTLKLGDHSIRLNGLRDNKQKDDGYRTTGSSKGRGVEIQYGTGSHLKPVKLKPLVDDLYSFRRGVERTNENIEKGTLNVGFNRKNLPDGFYSRNKNLHTVGPSINGRSMSHPVGSYTSDFHQMKWSSNEAAKYPRSAQARNLRPTYRIEKQSMFTPPFVQTKRESLLPPMAFRYKRSSHFVDPVDQFVPSDSRFLSYHRSFNTIGAQRPYRRSYSNNPLSGSSSTKSKRYRSRFGANEKICQLKGSNHQMCCKFDVRFCRRYKGALNLYAKLKESEPIISNSAQLSRYFLHRQSFDNTKEFIKNSNNEHVVENSRLHHESRPDIIEKTYIVSREPRNLFEDIPQNIETKQVGGYLIHPLLNPIGSNEPDLQYFGQPLFRNDTYSIEHSENEETNKRSKNGENRKVPLVSVTPIPNQYVQENTNLEDNTAIKLNHSFLDEGYFAESTAVEKHDVVKPLISELEEIENSNAEQIRDAEETEQLYVSPGRLQHTDRHPLEIDSQHSLYEEIQLETERASPSASFDELHRFRGTSELKEKDTEFFNDNFRHDHHDHNGRSSATEQSQFPPEGYQIFSDHGSFRNPKQNPLEQHIEEKHSRGKYEPSSMKYRNHLRTKLSENHADNFNQHFIDNENKNIPTDHFYQQQKFEDTHPRRPLSKEKYQHSFPHYVDEGSSGDYSNERNDQYEKYFTRFSYESSNDKHHSSPQLIEDPKHSQTNKVTPRQRGAHQKYSRDKNQHYVGFGLPKSHEKYKKTHEAHENDEIKTNTNDYPIGIFTQQTPLALPISYSHSPRSKEREKFNRNHNFFVEATKSNDVYHRKYHIDKNYSLKELKFTNTMLKAEKSKPTTQNQPTTTSVKHHRRYKGKRRHSNTNSLPTIDNYSIRQHSNGAPDVAEPMSPISHEEHSFTSPHQSSAVEEESERDSRPHSSSEIEHPHPQPWHQHHTEPGSLQPSYSQSSMPLVPVEHWLSTTGAEWTPLVPVSASH